MMMASRTSPSLIAFVTFLSAWISLATAHTIITYPGYRGDNLHKTGSLEETNGLGEANGTYPYGMQWMYPCGGMPTSKNRTLWPINGGAIAVQPGWEVGHLTAFFYINMGYGNLPLNMSHPMVPAFQIQGPTRNQYPGSFCLPQVPLPANSTFKVGDNATIQVIETAIHGASLYNCVDITFAEAKDVPEVNSTNCFNSTDIGFSLVFTTSSLSAAAPSPSSVAAASYLAFIPLLLAGLFAVLT